MFSSTWLLLFGAIFALSIRDLTVKMSDQSSASPSEEPSSAVPVPTVTPMETKIPDVEKERMKKASYTPRFQPSIPTLKFLYWYIKITISE